MIISYSEVFKWQTCQRQYSYSFMRRLRPLEESGAISTGIKGHALLQSFYEGLREGKSKEEAHALVLESAKKLMNKESFADFSLLKAWTLVDNFIRDNDFNSQAVLVENRFIIPVATFAEPSLWGDNDFEDVQIGFTPDVVLERTGGKLDIEDAKFVQRAWSKSKLNRYQQIKLYQIFLEAMGYDISRCLIRFFNVTTADISTQSYTMTKAEEQNLISDFLAGVGEIARYRRNFEENNTDTTRENFLQATPRTMNYTACQYCAFEFVCTLEAEGKSAQKSFDSLFTRSTYDYNG